MLLYSLSNLKWPFISLILYVSTVFYILFRFEVHCMCTFSTIHTQYFFSKITSVCYRQSSPVGLCAWNALTKQLHLRLLTCSVCFWANLEQIPTLAQTWMLGTLIFLPSFFLSNLQNYIYNSFISTLRATFDFSCVLLNCPDLIL